MIITKEVNVEVRTKEVKYWCEKAGYSCEIGDVIVMKIEDIPKYAKYITIKAQCNDCKGIFELQYENYNINMYVKKNKGVDQVYLCNKCAAKRMGRANSQKSKDKQKLFNDVREFVKNNGYITGLKGKDYSLYNRIRSHGYDMKSITKELGLEHTIKKEGKDIFTKEKIIEVVKDFIGKHSRFPTQIEMSKEYGLHNKYIYNHFDDIYCLKKYIGFTGKSDMIDLRGDYNRSTYELKVANFLVEQGYSEKYLREQRPFEGFGVPEYRSDFTMILESGEDIHIEVWGLDESEKRNKSSIYKNYQKIKAIKKKLYSKYNIKLIEIYPKDVNTTAQKTSENLYNIFQPYFNLKYKNVEVDKIISGATMKDFEVFEEMMKYSSNEEFLPMRKELEIDAYGKQLLNIIASHYGGMGYFAKKFNKDMWQKPLDYWDESQVLKRYEHLYKKYGRILNDSELDKKKSEDLYLRGLRDAIRKLGSKNSFKHKLAMKQLKESGLDECLERENISYDQYTTRIK